MWLLGKSPYILVEFQLRRICCFYIILLIENQFVMETQQLVDLGKQMNLAGEELHEFVRAEQALARDEIIRIREEKKEDEARIAEEAERIRKHEEEMFHLRIEADIIRRRWVLQEKFGKDEY